MKSVVLITGASTGFGRDAAERLAKRGHSVIATMRGINGRNKENREALEHLAMSANLKLRVIELDVTDERSVEDGVSAALAQFGRLDVVINNAGIVGFGVLEAYSTQQFQELFDVNVFGVVRVNRAVLPAMRNQKSGLLIHVSSGAGRVALPALGLYCSSKFALEAIADTYRYELTSFGIDSVLVEPGMYKTPLFERLLEPSDTQRLTEYGDAGNFAKQVLGVFQSTIDDPGTPGLEEVSEAFIGLIEMEPGKRPFRTVVSAPIEQLLNGYNDAAAALRPVVAQILGVPQLVEPLKKAAAAE